MDWYRIAEAKSNKVRACPKCQKEGTCKFRNQWSPLQCDNGHTWWKGTGEEYKEERDDELRWGKCLDAEALAYYDLLWRKQIEKNIADASHALDALKLGESVRNVNISKHY